MVTLPEILAYNLGRGTTSCGCGRINTGLKNRIRPYEALYNKLIYDSKREHKANLLSYEEFLEFTKISSCHYCTAPIAWSEHNFKNGWAYNLDRKDNNTGYLKDNCVVCCTRCNFSKSDRFSYDEWYAMTILFRDKKCLEITKIMR